jgi:hypothetical protein
MAWNEPDSLLVRVSGVEEATPAERSKLEAACSARLSIPVALLPGEAGHAGWKEERIKRNTAG